MAQECDGPRAAPETACPLRCRLLQGRPSDARDRVDWAGLPVNLDLVFSRNHRDKVYVQHLLRKRDTQLSRQFDDDPRPCARGNDCPLVKDGDHAPNTGKAYVRSLSADKRYYRDVS